MLYNILVAGPSVLPSGNDTSGQAHTGWIPKKNVKKSTQDVGLKHAARNVGIVRKKDVEGELERISERMPVVHVAQRNVKERIADTPLIPVNFFFEGSE